MNDFSYEYDGSFDGFLCCVFYSYENKEIPTDIFFGEQSLFFRRVIETEDVKAKRVERGILLSLGTEFYRVVKYCFLSRVIGTELSLLQFIRMGYELGNGILRNLGDELVNKMVKLSKSVEREGHRIKEFLRFSEHEGSLIAVINPKHFILPIVARHFIDRFPRENFFIFDEVFFSALIYMDGRSAIVAVDEFTMPELTKEEEKFRRLWKIFYDTVEIKERTNHRLRMQHMPKRFWKNMTELAEK